MYIVAVSYNVNLLVSLRGGQKVTPLQLRQYNVT